MNVVITLLCVHYLIHRFFGLYISALDATATGWLLSIIYDHVAEDD
jgi:hypothetical protein